MDLNAEKRGPMLNSKLNYCESVNVRGTETVEEIMSTRSNKRVRNRLRYMSNSGSNFVIVDRAPLSPQLWQRWPAWH